MMELDKYMMNRLKQVFYTSKKIFYINILFFLFIKISLAQNVMQLESLYIKSKIINMPVSKVICGQNISCKSGLTVQFYKQNQFMPVWNKNGNLHSSVKDFLQIINRSYEDGLSPKKYHIDEINALLKKIKTKYPDKNFWDFSANNLENSPELIHLLGDLDLLLTDSFFLYTLNLVYGEHIVTNKNKKGKSFYFSQMFAKKSINLIDEFNKALNGNLKIVLSDLVPRYRGYVQLKERLLEYRAIAKNGGWQKIPFGKKLTVGDKGIRVALLQKRLLTTGEFDIEEKNIKNDAVFDSNLEDAVSRFQDSHDLDVDGEVATETLRALNVPVSTRIRQIQVNMDRLRWLPNELGRNFIIINIPNFLLEAYDRNRVVLDIPVIVGRMGWRSCILSSKITSLELNPYWYVPRNIAVKEILPELKNDATFLKQNDIRAFQNINGQDIEIDSTKVNWSKVESSNFQFLFRQNPGVLNPLGKIKFVFPNNCTMFLHDTPMPDLFEYSRRDFSHGCIRVGKPLDLAAYLSKNQNSWTQEKILNKINSGQSETIKLTNPIDIYVIYKTVWVDTNDVLQFREDIYNMDNIPISVVIPEEDEDDDS